MAPAIQTERGRGRLFRGNAYPMVCASRLTSPAVLPSLLQTRRAQQGAIKRNGGALAARDSVAAEREAR